MTQHDSSELIPSVKLTSREAIRLTAAEPGVADDAGGGGEGAVADVPLSCPVVIGNQLVMIN